jgi:hypothetical protein
VMTRSLSVFRSVEDSGEEELVDGKTDHKIKGLDAKTDCVCVPVSYFRFTRLQARSSSMYSSQWEVWEMQLIFQPTNQRKKH